MTWPGAPTVYYADEAGQVGWTDPDDRRTYPWGHEDRSLIELHRDLIRLRRDLPILRDGSLKQLLAEYGRIAYARFNDTSNCVIAVNNTGGWTDFRLFVRDVGAKDGEIYYRRIQTTQDCHTTDLEKTGKVSEGYLSFDLAPFSSIVLSNVPGESLSEDTEVFPVQREAEPVHTQPPAEAVPAEQPNKTVPEESRPEIPAAPTQPSVETAPAVQPSESAPQEDSRETPAAAADAEQI